MGLMDAFNPEATTELKVGELYRMLQQAAENETTAKFLMNGVKNEVPYKYIREVVTGEKEDDEKDPITISIDEETAGHIAGMFGDMLGAHIEAIKDPCEGCNHFDECHPQDDTDRNLQDMDDEELKAFAEEIGVIGAGEKTREELIDAIKVITLSDMVGDDPAAGDEDFDPLPFPEVCKNAEENDRYHELAKETKTDLEHIAHDLGINNACYLSKGKILDLIIEYERKAAGEDKGGEK